MNDKETKEKLTVDILLNTDGFVKYGEEGTTTFDYTKADIFKMLHEENPIKKLKEFGFFQDKDKIKNETLEYANIYNIDLERKSCVYLLLRNCVFEKEIKNNMIIINWNDNNIRFECPLYYLSVMDSNNNLIDSSLYIVKIMLETGSELIVTFKDGYIKDDMQKIYDIFGKHKVQKIKNLCVISNFCIIRTQIPLE